MAKPTLSEEIINLSISTIRVLSAEMVSKANSGHPGAPMGMAPIAYLLFSKFMRFSPSNPDWPNRDRFVLSNGHACALQYSMLHLTGYSQMSMEAIKKFRQIDSVTPGHPEVHITDGVEVTTGPLGQGLASAVGLAIAEAHLSATFGAEVFDNFTYVFCGDGCLMEGITSEAASLAGHLGLNKLIVFYDDNKISIDGSTELAFTEDVKKRFESYGWHVIEVANGDTDLKALEASIVEARSQKSKPTLVKIRTTIGYGSKLQGTEKVHGAPLSADDLKAVKEKFGFGNAAPFFVDPRVYQHLDRTMQGRAWEAEWNERVRRLAPNLARDLQRRLGGYFPSGLDSAFPVYTPQDKPLATRQLSEICLNKIAPILPELIGGSADLTHSNLTAIKGWKDFQKGSRAGHYIRFGVREHAMAAITNGLSAYGGKKKNNLLIPFASTFLNFIGYALGAVTLSALSHLRGIYIMTHDSIGLGEDGPTHQPVEKYLLCRSTPNLFFIRPGDGNEVSGAYRIAVTSFKTPTVIALSRQPVPQLSGTSADGVLNGAYAIRAGSNPSLILIGTGTELSLCVDAAAEIEKRNTNVSVRVVSMPCWELYDKQPIEYKMNLFANGKVPVLSVEAGTTKGWAQYAHLSMGVDTFGASGPIKAVYQKFGLTVENVVANGLGLIKFFASQPVPNLVARPSKL